MVSNECEDEKAAWCRILFPPVLICTVWICSFKKRDPRASDLHASCIQTLARIHQCFHDDRVENLTVLYIIHVRRLSHFQCPQQLGLIPRTRSLCTEVEVKKKAVKTSAIVSALSFIPAPPALMV